MLEIHGKDQTEAEQIVHHQFQAMVDAFHRAFDDFGAALFQFRVQGLKIIDPDIGINAQPAAARLIRRRNDTMVRFAEVNDRDVTPHHGVNRRIEKIPENLEAQDVPVVFRGGYDVGHDELRGNGREP